MNEGIGVAEHKLGQRLGEQRFAHARGARKNEAAGGPLAILETAAAAADGLGHRFDRLLLADDPLVQLVFHLHEAHAVFGRQPSERNAGHLRDDFGDHFFVNHTIGLARFSRCSLVIVSFFFLSLSAWSRRAAAFSKSWLATASSFSLLRRSTSSSISFRSGGLLSNADARERRLHRSRRSPYRASNGPGCSGSDISTAEVTASSVICTR